MKILAATDFSTRSNRALRQAGLLAQASGAALAIVHVVDDDQPQALLEMERREAYAILHEQISVMPELQKATCNALVVTGSPFSGILDAATTMQTDLIVMGAHRRQLLRDIFVGTTVERVIRTGPFPVLMVNREVQQHYDRVLIPVEASEPSIHALRMAKASGLINLTDATLLHAFVAIGKGKLQMAGANTAEYEASERQYAKDELVGFLAANELGSQKWSLRIEEGAPMDVITRVVDQMRADLVIMGTHARSGLLKELIGSVTEAVLRSVNADVLAVPPAKH
jgi:nucleotide-binding universal stress UspA family protein